MKQIELLHPELQEKCHQLLRLAKSKGYDLLVTQTLRTKKEQDDLYAQGRTKPGKIVTWVSYPMSLHCWGVAFDIAVLLSGKVTWDTQHYDRIGPLGESLGLEWGGRWTNFPDKPHFQLKGFEAKRLVDLYRSPEVFTSSYQEKEPQDKETLAKIIVGKIVIEGKIIDGETFAPVRKLAEALEKKVNWDQTSKTVTIE
ncbi:M15 family metallopeptidase [Candidatus Formimonas warabiya]|uniref:M15 family metallopeptidase n=1 Tax=Formimonas warabiya TaxID=1761012 RepID=A0A3G1KQ36_FORW1|nr:M15 family metallopeptidase [Candidatus Formimonas warabiya]ATW24582.1 hypothetical protein DCMF_07100 [Candidatus Formimonas warabiya]